MSQDIMKIDEKTINTVLGHAFDTDLPPMQRAEANYWKALYFQAKMELQNANRGLERLVKKIKRMRDAEVKGEEARVGIGLPNMISRKRALEQTATPLPNTQPAHVLSADETFGFYGHAFPQEPVNTVRPKPDTIETSFGTFKKETTHGVYDSMTGHSGMAHKGNGE